MFKNQKIFAIAALSGLLLAGCSGSEPSEADIRSAFDHQLEGANSLIGRLGADQKVEILSLTKHQCKEKQDSTAVICSFTVKMKIPMLGEQEQTTENAFIKGPDGWRFLGN